MSPGDSKKIETPQRRKYSKRTLRNFYPVVNCICSTSPLVTLGTRKFLGISLLIVFRESRHTPSLPVDQKSTFANRGNRSDSRLYGEIHVPVYVRIKQDGGLLMSFLIEFYLIHMV